MIQTFFRDIRRNILQELEKATSEINIAVCWFTNEELFNVICKKLENKVSVTLIVLNDSINNKENGLNFQKFIELGGKFYFSHIDKPMHNKYCIIDNNIIISGSYNWTYFAEEKNEENINIISEPGTILEYSNDFKRLALIMTLVVDVKTEANRNSKVTSVVEDSFIASINDIVISNSIEETFPIRYISSSIGIGVKDDEFFTFISKNAQIPTQEKTISAVTAVDGQVQGNIDIRFGESKASSMNHQIGKFMITEIPALPSGEAKLITTFSIDNNGILTVLVTIKQTQKSFKKNFDIRHLIVGSI